MASFDSSTRYDAEKSDCFHKLIVRLYNFSVPNPLKQPYILEMFKLSFKSYLGTPEILDLIGKLDFKRSAMINQLNDINASIDSKLSSVDQYLPYLFQFKYLLDNQSDAIKCDRPMIFEWCGAIDRKSNNVFKSSEILFELLMTLHTKAILHHNYAKSLVDVEPLSFLIDAGKHLLEGSSIFLFIANNIASGQWKKISNIASNTNSLPEVSEQINLSLGLLLKGYAQDLSCAKAICVSCNSSPSAVVKSRLCVGAVNSLIASMNILIQYFGIYPPSHYTEILVHIHTSKQILCALAFQYIAKDCLEKAEVGNAIGYCHAAKDKIKEQPFTVNQPWTSDSGLINSKLSKLYKEIGPAISFINSQLDEVIHTADRDNRFIYFQAIPELQNLPSLPAEASVMNPTLFKEPIYDTSLVTMLYQAPKTTVEMVTGLFGGVLGGSTSVAVRNENISPSAPPLTEESQFIPNSS